MPIKVMIVDDQSLIREGLKAILSQEDDIDTIATAENGKDAIQKVHSVQPDVILMDISMPEMDGVKCTQFIKKKYPHIKILMLTTYDEDKYIIDALKLGAEGYILKNISIEKIVMAVKDIYAGINIMQPEITAKLVSCLKEKDTVQHKSPNTDRVEANHQNHIDDLTERENEVLKLVADGLNNQEIAKQLCISVGTVKNYISIIYDKTGITERTKLVSYVMKKEQI